MAKHYDGKDVEIIPPSTTVALHRASKAVAPVQRLPAAPYRADPGGIVSGIPKRWVANSQARTYDTFSRRAVAERKLVEADTDLGHSLIKNARMRHEYAELPQVLAADRMKRQIARENELREAVHQYELAEARRTRERSFADADLAVARKDLLNAEQALDAQREFGPRYHALDWVERIGERELRVEEQQAILTEHRRRYSDTAHTSDEELYRQRAELNADGADTSAIDLAIARSKARGRK